MEALVEDARKAILANDAAALRDAIRRGADVNGMVPCTNNRTGARGRYPLLCLAASEALAGMCEILLAEGADLNLRSTTSGYSALHSAAHKCSATCVRLLLRAGADVNARANNGGTPLHAASYNGRVHAAKVLIAAGGNLEVRTRAGCTSLRFALLKGHREIALTLLRAGAAITALRAEWITPENKALHNYMIDIIDTGGWNARVERHRRPLMSILSNLALPHDALRVILSFWSPPGGR
jgi:ankyrin repeat protein